MTLRLHARALLYFDAIRKAGSIREAARRLHVASSAVNRQLLELEDQIGAPLFERLPAGLQLTAAGEVVARHVIVVLGRPPRGQRAGCAARHPPGRGQPAGGGG
jgi:DNA-binding transcriptional LysR family regulator